VYLSEGGGGDEKEISQCFRVMSGYQRSGPRTVVKARLFLPVLSRLVARVPV